MEKMVVGAKEGFVVTPSFADNIREVINLCLEEAIILGIADGNVRERLLRKNELTLENTLDIFRA